MHKTLQTKPRCLASVKMNRLGSLSIVVFVTIALAYPLGQQMLPAQKTTRDNLKMTSVATLLYLSDWDDVLPHPRETKSVFAAIYPYCKNVKVFRSANPGSRILFNLSIGGVAQTSIEKPAGTVLFYDEKPWPDGSHLASFCDGHVSLISAASWKKVAQTLHLKLKATAKPLPKDYWKRFTSIKGLPD